MKRLMFILIVLVAGMRADRVMAQASEEVESTDASLQTDVSELMPPDSIHIEQTTSAALNPFSAKPTLPSIYELPYSVTLQSPDWHRMWINTAVLTGACNRHRSTSGGGNTTSKKARNGTATIPCSTISSIPTPEPSTSWPRARTDSISSGRSSTAP